MQGIKKNLIYQMIYRVLTVITPLITSPLLARALGAESLGVYSATQAYVSYFMMFALLGVENYGNRSIAAVQSDARKRQELFWNIYTVQFCASVLSLGVYFSSLFFISRERWLVSVLQGLWLLSSLFDINWFFFGCEQFKHTITRNIVVKLITVFCIVLFVHTAEDLTLYTLIMAGSTAVSQFLMWSFLPRYISFEWPVWSKVKTHILPMFKLFIPIIAFSIFHIMDKTMLDILSDEKNVGYYYSADKIINIPLGLINAVSTVMLPRMTNIVHNGTKEQAKQMLKKSSELVAFLTVAIAVGIGAVAKEFVPFFFGPGFEECVTLIYVFIPILFVKAGSELIRTQYLIPTSKDGLYTGAIWAGAAANIVSNYVLISRFGALGAVLGTLIAETVVLMIQMVGVRKHIPFMCYFASTWPYLLFGALMLACVRIFAVYADINGFTGIVLMVILGAVVYLICCCSYWLWNKKSVFFTVLEKLVRYVRKK